MSSWEPLLFPPLRQAFLCLVRLGKGGKESVQIGSWSLFALLITQLAEQCCHRRSFVDEAANVPFRLSQANCLREGCQSLRLLLDHLVSQGLQEPDLNDMAPALACCGALHAGL